MLTYCVESIVMQKECGLVLLICIGLQDIRTFAILTEIEKCPCKTQSISRSVWPLKIVIVERLLREWLVRMLLCPACHDFVCTIRKEQSVTTTTIVMKFTS